MRSITAVEIGADTCALASTSVRGPEVYVSSAETLDPVSFPGIDAFTEALQQTRKALKLPRRCRAVVWGLPDGATRRDPVVAPLVEPLTRAGFKIARVVTPCNALGALARLRTSRTGGAMCWLGINRNGVAIVVIRPGKLLYSHSFAWDSNVGASGSQARLLQRYSLVAFLAPEVRRAIAVAQQKGASVDGIVTCGNLPDLRSLTMPLIEELDIEVETLDSLEGLQMKPDLADRLSEVAPAIRLACAGAFARETRTVDESKRQRVRLTTRATSVLRIAALLALLAGAGYWWYTRHQQPVPASGPARPANTAASKRVTPPVSSSAPAIPPPAVPAAKPTPAPVVTSQPAPAVVAKQAEPVATKPTAPPPATGTPASKAPSTPAPTAAAGSKPTSAAPPPPATKASTPASVSPGGKVASTAAPSAAAGSKPTSAAPPPATKPSTPASGSHTPAPVSATSAPPAPAFARSTPALSPPPSGASARGTVNPAPAPADNRAAGSAVRPPAAHPAQPMAATPELLKDPVPRVTAILVAADRRLATIGDEGQIIAVGDTVGRRVVVAIDDRTVLLREPSGVQIRVALGGRVVGVERPGR